MSKRISAAITLYLVLNIFRTGFGSDIPMGSTPSWQAGVASVIITPEEPMWMAGYASRNHPSEGTLHDLWAKALAFKDASGKKAVLVTSDIVGFSRVMSDHIRDRLKEKYGLDRDQILLNSSHTHTGPEVDLEKFRWRLGNPDPQQVRLIEQYNKKLEDNIVEVVGKAFNSMQPVEIFSQNGFTRFQINRRNNREAEIHLATDLNGPNDYAVPVIKVVNTKGELVAVAFGYSCHATVLSFYKWSGDYPGFAQIEVEKNHPGTTALFFQCTGGNQNPLPRRSVALAQQYGQELAAAVERVMNEDMFKLEPVITTVYSEIDLPFSSAPSEAELINYEENSSGLDKSWARYMLEKIRKGEQLMASYPYPMQVWKLGDQAIMIMGGEVVVEYSIELKKIFGQDIFVLGYSNDPNMAYIPDSDILTEGGYEGETSMRAKGLPSKWSPDIETMILGEMKRLAALAGIVVKEPR